MSGKQLGPEAPLPLEDQPQNQPVIDHCNGCGGEFKAQEEDLCPKCGPSGPGLIRTWGNEQAERYRNGERYDDGPQLAEARAAPAAEPPRASYGRNMTERWADPVPDPRDARIAALEAELAEAELRIGCLVDAEGGD